jgi:glycosyltransferase involved in cell wall biosynthesis
MLLRRCQRTGVSRAVSFDDSYRDLPALKRLISGTDLVVLPYDSEDQVTSGVLVDAVACGRPVIATAFPHAVELLSSGAGVVVPQRDPWALAEVVRSVVDHPELLSQMAAQCRRLAPELSWLAVARRYDELATSLLATEAVSA